MDSLYILLGNRDPYHGNLIHAQFRMISATLQAAVPVIRKSGYFHEPAVLTNVNLR